MSNATGVYTMVSTALLTGLEAGRRKQSKYKYPTNLPPLCGGGVFYHVR